jgi:hypothetical protein
MAQQPPSKPGLPHYRGFTITLRHSILCRTRLDELSGWRRDLYLTTHNTRNRQTPTAPTGFESAIPASLRPKIHALDCAATGTGNLYFVECRIPYTQLWYVTRQPWYPNKGCCQQHSSLCCCFIWEPNVNIQTCSLLRTVATQATSLMHIPVVTETSNTGVINSFCLHV